MNVKEFPMEDFPSTAPAPPATQRGMDENFYVAVGHFPGKNEVMSNPAADTDFCE